jgi:hypothetical protein
MIRRRQDALTIIIDLTNPQTGKPDRVNPTV